MTGITFATRSRGHSLLASLAVLGSSGCTGGGASNQDNVGAPAPMDEDEGDDERGEEVLELGEAKFLVEHNSTERDTGFQGFVDGEPWNVLSLSGPDGKAVLSVKGERELKGLGMTELFFETDEPSNADVPIDELLATFAEGEYRFQARSVDGIRMEGVALLTHDVPEGPVITSPPESPPVDLDNVVVRWNKVDETITGDDVTIVSYEVIVEKDVEEVPFPDAFAKQVLSAHVLPSVTSLNVPPQFLEPGTAYKVEVLAIEESGNQTITESSFETQ